MQRYGGTRVANFPVVMSLLFDDQGIVRAFRAVTDSRASVDDRGKAYLLRFRLYPIYGSDGWNCVDREPAPGETGVGRTYLNQLCTKEIDGKWVRIEVPADQVGLKQGDAVKGLAYTQVGGTVFWSQGHAGMAVSHRETEYGVPTGEEDPITIRLRQTL